MNKTTVKAAFDYCVDQAIQFQMTHDGNGNFSIDLQSKIHANVLWGELRSLHGTEEGKDINLLERPFFYRLS